MTSSNFHIRPRFTIVSDHSVGELHQKFKTALHDPNAPFDGKVRIGYTSIYPKLADHHYWSPHLSITIEPDEDDHSKTLLRGLYGPSPAVWTMFIFIYSVIALALVIVTVIGFANLSIDESGAVLWAVPVLVLLFLTSYMTSYFGQQKGHAQIEAIDEWFGQVMDRDISGAE